VLFVLQCGRSVPRPLRGSRVVCVTARPVSSTSITRFACCLSYSAAGQFDVHYEVRVLDLDKPWESFLVTSSATCVQHVEWDNMGTRLLLVDGQGDCQIWTMKVPPPGQSSICVGGGGRLPNMGDEGMTAGPVFNTCLIIILQLWLCICVSF
jgi:hypothetical protein